MRQPWGSGRKDRDAVFGSETVASGRRHGTPCGSHRNRPILRDSTFAPAPPFPLQSGGAAVRDPAMKVRASVRRVCEKCKIVRRRGVVFVVCADPRHKQRQG